MMAVRFVCQNSMAAANKLNGQIVHFDVITGAGCLSTHSLEPPAKGS
jgi:hypothetical protein